ncbi:MAG: hypothetical protein M1827_002184 [Pycnora praestabilis]|nr:MAG: hypothetical protein M1827_002184 [Pycnora praestabilis]
MLTSSPSPTLHPSPPSSTFHYSNGPYRRSDPQSPRQTPRQAPTSAPNKRPSQLPTVASSSSLRSLAVSLSPVPPRRTVDAGTQYSPPQIQGRPPPLGIVTEVEKSKGKRREPSDSPPSRLSQEEPRAPPLEPQMPTRNSSSEPRIVKPVPDPVTRNEASSQKRARPPRPAVKVMPIKYETCDVKDLVFLISTMLMELVRFNDGIPLKDGRLTRFHSRAPPGISIRDYLQRLTTHATLSPPILLSMVYYIDRLCALYPAFTISSLTVHRFLITSATVASKGLSDSFWTNSTYARVGGVSLRELALLELEFLWRVEWRIVPKPEVLVDYYRSLVERSEGYEVEVEDPMDESNADDEASETTEEEHVAEPILPLPPMGSETGR